MRAARAFASGALAIAARQVAAQALPVAVRSDPALQPSALRPSAAATAVIATHPIGLASVGLERDLGLYARFGIVGSAGASAADGGRAVGEVAAIGRFLLDPLRQSSRGVYATGGLALRVERTTRPRPFVLAGLGVEGRPRGRVIPALEAGLGGGARVSLVLRPTRANRR